MKRTPADWRQTKGTRMNIATDEHADDLHDVSIVVLSYNRLAELEINVPKLIAGASAHGCELILVDNNSTDGSQEYLINCHRIKPHFRIILNESNLGVAEGRNSGWRAATRAFILQVDDDTHFDFKQIVPLVSRLREDAGLGLVFPRILDYTTGVDTTHANNARHPANFHGACHLVRRVAVDSVGYIDPEFRFGGEELDYSIRLRAAGWEVEFLQSCSVRHHALIRRGAVSRSRRRLWLYSYTRVVAKHFPAPMALVHSWRLFVLHAMSGVRLHGFRFLGELIEGSLSGWRSGRSAHSPIPADVLMMYQDNTLRPEFGNVSISRKVSTSIRAGALRAPGLQRHRVRSEYRDRE